MRSNEVVLEAVVGQRCPDPDLDLSVIDLS